MRPVAGKRQVAVFVSAEYELQLSPLVRSQTSWVLAFQNRAWYSLSEAQKRLIEQGQSGEQITALSRLDDIAGKVRLMPQNHALLVMAKNLAASLVVLTDAQIARAVKLLGARDVVQTVHYTAMRSLFDIRNSLFDIRYSIRRICSVFILTTQASMLLLVFSLPVPYFLSVY